MRERSRLTANSLVLLGSQLGNRLLLLLLVAYLTRIWSTHEFGEYAFLMGMIALFASLADAGLTGYAVREMGRDVAGGGMVLRQTLVLRGILGIASGVGLWICVRYGWLEARLATASYAAGASVAIMSLSGGLLAWLQAQQRMVRAAATTTVATTIFVSGAALGVRCGGGLTEVLLAYGGSQLLAFLWLVQARPGDALRQWRGTFDLGLGRVWKRAWPYTVLLLLSTVQLRIDGILLAGMLSFSDAGTYHAAWKIVDVLQFIPSSSAGAFLPAAAALSLQGERLRHTYQGVAVVLVGIMVPLILLIGANGHALLAALYGSGYVEAATPLRLLLLRVTLFSFSAPVGSVILVSPRVGAFVPWAILNTALHVALNAWWIPLHGPAGAAAAAVTSEATGLAIQLVFARRMLGGLSTYWGIIRPTLVAAGVPVAIGLANGHLTWPQGEAALGTAVLFTLVYLLAVWMRRRPTTASD